METVLALGLAGAQEVLHQLEHADDVPLLCIPRVFGRQVLRQQENDRCQEALSGIVEKCVLPVAGSITFRVYDCFGEDFGVFFRLSPGGEIVGVLPAHVHIVVDERQEIVPIGAGGIAQIDHRHLVAIVLDGDSTIVPGQIPFGVQSQKAHAAGAGVFEVRV